MGQIYFLASIVKLANTTLSYNAVRGEITQLWARAPNFGLSKNPIQLPPRNTEVVRILLDGGADPNKKSKCGDTPLNEAWWDCLGVVKLLLEAGADPNWNGSDGMAPLHEAWNTDAVQILLDGGADPNYRDSDGSTPLHNAVTSCRKDLVQILLDGGALPDQVDDEGDTPYYLAARLGYKDIYEIIMGRFQLILK